MWQSPATSVTEQRWTLLHLAGRLLDLQGQHARASWCKFQEGDCCKLCVSEGLLHLKCVNALPKHV